MYYGMLYIKRRATTFKLEKVLILLGNTQVSGDCRREGHVRVGGEHRQVTVFVRLPVTVFVIHSGSNLFRDGEPLS
jgi:hypothetical protein